jgi:hypothetical protein
MVTDGKQWTPLPPMEILPQICFGQAASLAQLRVEPSVTIRLDQTNVPAPDLEAPREGDPGELCAPLASMKRFRLDGWHQIEAHNTADWSRAILPHSDDTKSARLGSERTLPLERCHSVVKL